MQNVIFVQTCKAKQCHQLQIQDTLHFSDREEWISFYSCLSILDIIPFWEYNACMKLTASVKLLVSSEQSEQLRLTMLKANEVCNRLSEWAWQHQAFGQYALHKAQYITMRVSSDLTAQVVVRCIAKVADAYKSAFALHKLNTERIDQQNIQRSKKNKELLPLPVMSACVFRSISAIAYDDRILRWYLDRKTISIWTVNGRQTIHFVCGDYHWQLLQNRQGETDLIFRDGNWYLLAACNIEELPPSTPEDFLGVDLGIANIAVDSEGNQYSGEAVNTLRRNVKKHRSGLQHQAKKHHSKSAYRKLCSIRHKQSRFVKWVNHNVSKKIVQTAVDNSKAIVLETLKGIRERVSASKELRWLSGNWSFAQLQEFICYKAKLVGIPVVFVNPAYTSQTCSKCGHCERANRPSQSVFKCKQCGFEANADFNSSLNIKARARVTSPMVGVCLAD